MNVFDVKQLFYKNALYFIYKLKIIEFKQITRTTRQNDKKKNYSYNQNFEIQ